MKRIDRRHETIMQLGAELSGQLHVDRIVGKRREQFPKVTFANAQSDVASLIREFRHVERITTERHQRGILLAGFEAFEISVLKYQKRSALVFQDRAMVGDDADTFLWVTAVIDEDADQHAAGLPLANTDGQVLIELSETAGLQD